MAEGSREHLAVRVIKRGFVALFLAALGIAWIVFGYVLDSPALGYVFGTPMILFAIGAVVGSEQLLEKLFRGISRGVRRH